MKRERGREEGKMRGRGVKVGEICNAICSSGLGVKSA
jgi:hypothetical protein